jgi:hypothetical protein
MTKLMEKAISKLRRLPVKRQDELAEVILDLAQDANYKLTTEQTSEIETAIEEADRGQFASEAELVALWKKFGL